MINLIGISGRISSGKDTVGQMIQELTCNKVGFDSYVRAIPKLVSDWQIKKFAFKLKQIVSILTGIPAEQLERQDVKDMVLGEEWSTFVGLNEVTKTGSGRRPLTVREVLQRVGTEAMREQVHQNVWVNALFADYNPISTGWDSNPTIKYPRWIITDVRFPNEAQAIKDRGGIVIRVNRPADNKITTFMKLQGIGLIEHPSETALDDYEFDEVIINDGTLEDLKEKVRAILIKHEA